MPRRDPVRREPSTGRSGLAVRESSSRILLVCGAEMTETAYFKGLRNLLRSYSIDIQVVEHPKAPDAVVSYARDHCDPDDFDQVWCILDVDHFEREGGKISAAFPLAEACGISLAVSNPCFEYWLLLHHADAATPTARCSEIADRLSRHVKSYDKARLRFADFSEHVETAAKRAKQRDPTGKAHVTNPSSGVWALVEQLLVQR